MNVESHVVKGERWNFRLKQTSASDLLKSGENSRRKESGEEKRGNRNKESDGKRAVTTNSLPGHYDFALFPIPLLGPNTIWNIR